MTTGTVCDRATELEPGAVAQHLERCVATLMHDDADLTSSHGFLPRRLDHHPLGGIHHAWEEAAAMLPALVFDSHARDVLGRLPLLSASAEGLPDHLVKRAATLLGLIAHSYWRFGLDRMFVSRNNDIPDQLPAAILKPRTQVCRRLGRRGPGLTLEDWVFSNFTFTDPARVDRYGHYGAADITNEAIERKVAVAAEPKRGKGRSEP